MNRDTSERLKLLGEESIIWIISIFLAIGALTSSILETEDVKNGNNKNRKAYQTLDVTIFIVAILINIYFLIFFFSEYKKHHDKRLLLNITGSILAIIGVSLFLLSELIFINRQKEE